MFVVCGPGVADLPSGVRTNLPKHGTRRHDEASSGVGGRLATGRLGRRPIDPGPYRANRRAQFELVAILTAMFGVMVIVALALGPGPLD